MQLLRSFWAASLFFLTTTAWAGHITGQVRFDTGQPVDNAVIRLRSEMIAYQTETQTDRQGKFTFDGLPLSTFHLTLEFPGYHPYSASIDISMSKMSYEDVTLRRDRSKDTRDVPPEGPNGMVDARLAQMPPEAKAELDAGMKKSAAHDLGAALEHYQKAIELFPTFAEAYFVMGGVYLEQGSLSLAEQSFAKAVFIENRFANAHLALGLTRNLMGRTREAEPALLRAVELDPQNPDAQVELAKNQFALQKFPDAQAHAEKALQLRPKNPPVYVILGYSLLRQKKVSEAEEAFRHFLKMDPSSPMAPDIKQIEAMIEQHEQPGRQR
jgi:tetratricopeptide (TPR) repeat protein